MYATGIKHENGEERQSDVRAAMRTQQERSQAKRLAGLARADQRSQLDARARWWQRLARPTSGFRGSA
jgi:hypothetical protein